MRLCRILILAGMLASAAAAGAAGAVGSGLVLNEDYIRNLHQSLDVEDSRAVFARVFHALPERVFVYPTENYYYFRFAANGRVYSGNLRLAPDAGVTRRLHFAYAEEADPANAWYAYLGPEHGVLVEPTAPLRYSVAAGGTRVSFQLNPLPQTLPPGFPKQPWEVFIGRSMDESGLGFLLLFNLHQDHFFWVLDETAQAHWPMRRFGRHLLLQPASGFVFFDDRVLGRRLLVGVERSQVLANTWLDGPFDQLPDNFIAQTAFAELALRAFPALRGRINRRGELSDIPARIALLNYRLYASPAMLIPWTERCIAQARDAVTLTACLTRLSQSPR
jgi:hypothetical protein